MPHAPIATRIVTSTANNGAGTLRRAIADAVPGDTIVFSLTYPAIITLTSAPLSITKNLIIDGPGAAYLTVSGNHARRVFYITSTVTISGVTIVDGRVTSVGGGGIYNESGVLTLINSIVKNNVGSTSGGGIRNVSGTLVLDHSSVMSNTASNGGGIWNISGTLTLNNSTVMRNTVEYGGGGIYNQAGVLTLTQSSVLSNTAGFGGGLSITWGGLSILNNSTLSGNVANSTHEYDGGGAIDQWHETSRLILNHSTIANNTAVNFNRDTSGIWLEGGVLTMTNSLVANNAITGNLKLESGTSFTSQGYNLSNDWHGAITTTHDLTSDPRLGLLADNGGPTWTHALQDGSPARDRIPYGVNGCGTTFFTDQRGLPRPSHARCDSGAYEVQGVGYQLLLPLIFKTDPQHHTFPDLSRVPNNSPAPRCPGSLLR